MSDNGEVGVEFPVLPYLSALIARPFGFHSLPWVMRILNFLTLFLAVRFFSGSFRKEIVPALLTWILFLSPMLVFYSFNFLPDTTGLAFLLFAFGFLFRSDSGKNHRVLILSICFAGFAALIKTSCGIFFLSIAGSVFLEKLLQKNYSFAFRILLISLAIGTLIITYDYFHFYNRNRQLWSVVFMSESQPLDQWVFFHLFRKSILFWFGQWISVPQLVALLLVGVYTIFYHENKPFRIYSLVLISSFTGVAAFCYLMGRQFINHDYYFVSVFIPLIFLIAGSILFFTRFNSEKFIRIPVLTVLFILLILSGAFAFNQYSERSSDYFTWRGRVILNELSWLKSAGQKLDSAGISKQSTVFVLYEFSPNTALVYLNRKGKTFNHEEMSRDSSNIFYWDNRIQPDLVILNKRWDKNLAKDQPQYFKTLEKFADIDSIVLYKPIRP